MEEVVAWDDFFSFSFFTYPGSIVSCKRVEVSLVGVECGEIEMRRWKWSGNGNEPHLAP